MPCATNRARAAAAGWSRRLFLAALGGSALLARGRRGGAQELRFFRIGTGGVAGTYYPIGNLIAGIISNPPGARPCDKGGSCGVPGLVATVQSSEGSIANIRGILDGSLDSGFVQADIAYDAYRGLGQFAGRPATGLRAIAKLYNESIHLLVRGDRAARGVPDIAGLRISLDEPGSGTLVDARLVLGAFGVEEGRLGGVYVKPDVAVSMMRKDRLDGFFIVAGYPTAAVTEATGELGARLVPIKGEPVDRLIRRYPFFTYDLIPFGVYPGQPTVETIGVGALWLVSARLEEELVYGITKALWAPFARRLLDNGHPKGREIRLENALESVSVPLHAGAERYYREIGVLR